jgi:hypothetical protein
MWGSSGESGFSKLLISQFCAKTGEQKVIKDMLSIRMVGQHVSKAAPAAGRRRNYYIGTGFARHGTGGRTIFKSQF